MKAYLTRIEPAADMARFYVVTVQPTLFGDWSVMREWGRIGQGGTTKMSAFASEDEADSAALALVAAKVRRGYCQKSWTA